VHEHLLGVRGEVGELVDGLPVLAEPRGLVRASPGVGLAAPGRMARQAELAVTAKNRQASDHPVSRFHVLHLGAGRLDDAGGFVPEHRWNRPRIAPLLDVQVAVADTGCDRADQDLARSRLSDIDILDLERLTRRPKHRCFHGIPTPFLPLSG
jgi:hypothetical protein